VSIDSATSLGTVTLTVNDLDGVARYYSEAIGLRELGRGSDQVDLGVEGNDRALVRLVADPDAPPRPPRTTGLFHLAVLVPSRAALARALHRVTAAGQRFTGASDHLVSEALYLDDPEGNGIEIYRDRPRNEWNFPNGELEMATLPMDLEGVLASAPEGETDDGLPPGTGIGHVHLQVARIPDADSFWIGGVGFDPVVRSYPGALFVSAGGYHHHVGLNTWAGVGAPAPPPRARGLRDFEILLPSAGALAETVARLEAAGIELGEADGSVVVADPSGNRAVLTTA
jgi:catechol 2,3-dioxygenase